jgi:hypothetical protein
MSRLPAPADSTAVPGGGLDDTAPLIIQAAAAASLLLDGIPSEVRSGRYARHVTGNI